MIRSNKALVRYNQQQHGVGHHRPTLDDDSHYTLGYKHNKKELDRLLGKCDLLRGYLDRMQDLKERERMQISHLEDKIDELDFELETIEGGQFMSQI